MLFLKFVLQHRLSVLLLGFILLIGGIFAWREIPIDAFPDVTNVQVVVLSEATGLAPLEVERQITLPIEITMNGLPDVRQVRSLSKAGLSQVVVIFEDDVDIYFARQLVLEKLLQAREKLPPGVDPELGPISTGLGEIYQYSVKAGYFCSAHKNAHSVEAALCPVCSAPMEKANYSLAELRTLQDWVIAPKLRQLPGVNEVNSFGGFVKQYHVVPDPVLLLKYDLSLSEVIEALEINNANVGGNYLVRSGEQRYIVTDGLFKTIEDIEKIVLNAEDGTPVYLKDIATVGVGAETRKGAVTQDGKGEAVIGMVVMLRGKNSKHVVDRVKNEIPVIQKMLPDGVVIVPFYDRTSLIEACVDTVASALELGVVLLILVLFLLFWDLRAALAVALCLPLVSCFTFISMYLTGMTANLMSLGGLVIALGVLVDASIVVTDNIARYFTAESLAKESRMELAYRAVSEVARPVFYSVLIIIAVFLPLFSLEAMEKKMFMPLAIVICFAMAGSIVIAMSVTAVAASLLVKRKTAVNLAEKYALKLYAPLVKKTLAYRKTVVAVAVVLLMSTAIPIAFLGTEFLPSLDEGALAVNVVRLPSAALEVSRDQSLYLEEVLLARFPELSTIVSKTGRAEIAEDPMGPEQTDMVMMFKPGYEKIRGKTKPQLIEEIRREMNKVPGLKPAFSQPIALRVNELVSGVKSDVAIKIFGDDLERLEELGKKIAPVLGEVRGATDIKIEQVSGFSQIEVSMNRPEMARHKVNAGLINHIVEAAVGGKIVTYFVEGERRFAVLVRFPEENRRSVPAIGRILVPSPSGYPVPLENLTFIREVDVPAQVSRESGKRRLVVECNVQGRDLGGFIAEAKARLSSIEKDLPSGCFLSWGGQFENQERAMRRLTMLVPIVILLVFFLLCAAVKSAKSAAMAFLNLPFALVGGLWILFLLKINVSVAAVIGLIALFGMAVEQSTLLTAFFRELEGRGLSAYDAVIEGTRLRLRAILATSLTTVVGLTPIFFSSGAGSEIQRPLATVVLGGMSAGLVLVLFIFPAVYLLFNDIKRPKTSKKDSPNLMPG